MQNNIKPILLGILTLITLACILTGYYLVDSNAKAIVWNDINSDGKKDQEELPIEGIKVCATTNPRITNEYEADYCYNTDTKGNAPSNKEVRGMFFPGASCRDIYIFVVLPEGYDLTTPGRVNDCYAGFGLVRKSP